MEENDAIFPFSASLTAFNVIEFVVSIDTGKGIPLLRMTCFRNTLVAEDMSNPISLNVALASFFCLVFDSDCNCTAHIATSLLLTLRHVIGTM